MKQEATLILEEEAAELLLAGENFDGFAYEAYEDNYKGRWHNYKVLVISEVVGANVFFWGTSFAEGATENQESYFENKVNDGFVEFFPVKRTEIISYKYEYIK